jgi:hypothetical protein
MDHILSEKEEYPKKDYLFSVELPVWCTPLCAWCLSEQGLPAGEGSHGICKMHANLLRLQQQKLRSARLAQKGT